MARLVDGTDEHEISLAVLRYLNQLHGGGASVSQIKRQLPNHINLTDADREQSGSRNEERWVQRMGNIVSHRNTPDNIINDGLVTYRRNWLAITDAGRNYLKRRRG